MEVRVPDLGDFSDVDVIDILVKPGDVVDVEDSLITLETDKATMDVPSPAAGKIVELKVEQGSTVSAGDLIAVIAAESDDAGSDDAGSDDAGSDSTGADAAGSDDANAGSASAARPDSAAGAQTEASAGQPTADSTTQATDRDDSAAESDAKAEPRLVTVPDLGDFSDVDVIDVLVAAGDEVEAEQGLITLETDKATMDVPTPFAGRVLELRVGAGSTVNPGDPVALIEPAAGAGEQTNAPAPAQAAEQSARQTSAEAPSRPEALPARAQERGRPGHETALPAVGIIDEAAFSTAHASPSVRKLARELGVGLGHVHGTGRKGRITTEDLKAYVKEVMTGEGRGAKLPELPQVDFAKFGPVERIKLTRIQKIAGPRLHASWVNLPHVTQHDDADITELEAKRQDLKAEAERRDVRLTPVAFILRAVVLTLQDFPKFRSSMGADGASLIVKDYYHLGFAADTPNGLVVPVIRDADSKNVFELAEALASLSARARDGKLSADDVQGGVFTISSLGGIGGSYFTPIINAPEVAILGVSRSRRVPVYVGDTLEPRLMLPLSLSYDHRVIDGAEAARFITQLSQTLGQVDRLLEEPA